MADPTGVSLSRDGSATIANMDLDPLAAGSVTIEYDDERENVVASEHRAESVMLLLAWSLECDIVLGEELLWGLGTAASCYG